MRLIAECDFATWMEDGRRILCSRGGRVLAVDASTGQETELQVGTGVAPLSPRLAVETPSCSSSGARRRPISG
jgi:hypothetical protein